MQIRHRATLEGSSGSMGPWCAAMLGSHMSRQRAGRRTKHIGGGGELEELGQGGAGVVAADQLLQRGAAQQRVPQQQGRQHHAAPLHLCQPQHPRQRPAACPTSSACVQPM